MPELTVRRCCAIFAIVAFFAVVVIAALHRLGSESRVVGKSGLIGSPDIVKLMADDPSEAYRIWKEFGYRGRIIVYLADRWETCNPDEMIPAPLARPYPLSLVNPARFLEENNLNGATFLYIASLNRITRKIVALLPPGEISRMVGATKRGKDFQITSSGIDDSRQGFPRRFTTVDHFAGSGEPVLLYVGASCLRAVEPEELYRLLIKSGVTTDCVILCREKGKDSVSPVEVAKLHRFARLMGLRTLSGSRGATRYVAPMAAVPAS